MTTADLLDGAFAVIKAQPRSLAVCALVVVLPIQVLIAWTQRDLFGGAPIGDVFSDPTLVESSSSASDLAYLGVLLQSFAASVLAVSVMTVISGHLAGTVPSTAAVVRATVRRAPVILVAWCGVHIAELAGCFGFGIGGLYLMGAFLVVAPAIATESIGPIAALRRSWRLTATRRWQMVGVGVMSAVVIYTLTQILTIVPQLLAFLVGTEDGWVLLAAGSTAVSLLTVPLTAAVSCLAYLDLRVRLEGLDLEMDAVEAFDHAR
jgi:hypothetical protein